MTEGVRQIITCMHLSFLFDLEYTKRNCSQILDRDTGSVLWHLPVSDACKSSWTLRNHEKKEDSTREAPMTNTAQLSHSCWQMGTVTFATRSRSACHAKWMGIQLAEPKSIRPARQERVLIINHSLMQKAWNDAPKKVDQTELDRKQVK